MTLKILILPVFCPEFDVGTVQRENYFFQPSVFWPPACLPLSEVNYSGQHTWNNAAEIGQYAECHWKPLYLSHSL